MNTWVGRAGSLLGVFFFLGFGAWALVAPSSFYERIAPWPPYNEHLVHDAGAFQVGVGVALAATLARMRGPLPALAGAVAAAVLHVVAHLIDQGDGGRSSDPYVLAALALVLFAAFVAELRSGRVQVRRT